PRAPVQRLHAAQDDIAIIVSGVFMQKGAYGMTARNVEHRRHLPLPCAVAPEGLIAPAAERKRQRIEQHGLPRARLAGQHRQARLEIDVEPFDQDDITNRQMREHGANSDRWLFGEGGLPSPHLYSIDQLPKSEPALAIQELLFSR